MLPLTKDNNETQKEARVNFDPAFGINKGTIAPCWCGCIRPRAALSRSRSSGRRLLGLRRFAHGRDEFHPPCFCEQLPKGLPEIFQ